MNFKRLVLAYSKFFYVEYPREFTDKMLGSHNLAMFFGCKIVVQKSSVTIPQQ